MTYKITSYYSYHKENRFHLTKKELFEFIDDWGFCFVDDFNKSKERGVFIDQIHKYNYNYERNISINIYINGLFILTDIHGYSIDIKSLKEDYKKSRKIKPKKYSSYKQINRGTKKYKKSRFKDIHKIGKCRGISKEYKDSFTAEEYGVQIRTKRYLLVKDHHIFYYDPRDERETSKSWKQNKKNKKQWCKKLM